MGNKIPAPFYAKEKLESSLKSSVSHINFKNLMETNPPCICPAFRAKVSLNSVSVEYLQNE